METTIGFEMQTTFGFEYYQASINLIGLRYEYATNRGYDGSYHWFRAALQKIEVLKNA